MYVWSGFLIPQNLFAKNGSSSFSIWKTVTVSEQVDPHSWLPQDLTLVQCQAPSEKPVEPWFHGSLSTRIKIRVFSLGSISDFIYSQSTSDVVLLKCLRSGQWRSCICFLRRVVVWIMYLKHVALLAGLPPRTEKVSGWFECNEIGLRKAINFITYVWLWWFVINWHCNRIPYLDNIYAKLVTPIPHRHQM